jgi:hypothetical protein
MPKFVTHRDFEFIQHINRELVSDVIDVLVILYKVIPDYTTLNIYGESSSKVRYTGITVPCIITYKKTSNVTEEFGPDSEQDAEFAFVRRKLEEANVRPEIGDIIGYNDLYYEVDNTSETQLIGSRPEFVTSIIAFAHLTRMSGITIEPRQV